MAKTTRRATKKYKPRKTATPKSAKVPNTELMQLALGVLNLVYEKDKSVNENLIRAKWLMLFIAEPTVDYFVSEGIVTENILTKAVVKHREVPEKEVPVSHVIHPELTPEPVHPKKHFDNSEIVM